MKKLLFTFLFLAYCNWLAAQIPDSLSAFLANNEAVVRQMVNGYKKVSVNWAQVLWTLGGLIGLLLLTWKLWGKDWLKELVRKKSEQAIDSLNNLKTTKILVLSNGNESFLKSFFKTKGIPNCRFIQLTNAFIPVNDFGYDVVFANNDEGNLDKNLVRQYVKEENVLFYFGKNGTWDFANDTPELSRKINFANSRAQVYGNLMSSLEFLDLIKPKIKNS